MVDDDHGSVCYLIIHNSDYCIIQESVYFLPVDGCKMMLLDGEVIIDC